MSQNVRLEGQNGGSKYKRIYLDLREALAVGTYSQGEKLPSENDLVETFGASRPTVRRALAQLEADGLVERRAGSGTFVCRQSHQKNFVFGLLIPELGITEIFEPVCRGISQAHLGGHHGLLWGPTFAPGASKESQAEQLCKYFIKRSVSGVFFAPLELSEGKDEVNLSIARALDDARIPIVLLDRDMYDYPKRSQYDLVGIDNRRAGFVVAEHLLLSGSRRVAFFARPYSAPTVSARIAGYREAIRAHLDSGSEDLVEYGDPSDIVAVRHLLSRTRPDAVVCANDYTAAQLMTTLNEIGVHVPSEIRIVGLDDVKYARLLQVPLTTIHQPCREIGFTALVAMLDRVAHPHAPAREFLVDFHLVIRQSTDAAHRAKSRKSDRTTRSVRVDKT
jgi:DNA-binding LacI/PurR family transcriptional regulator